MKEQASVTKWSINRRSFLKKGALGAGAAAIAAGLVPLGLAFGRTEDDGGPVTKGDIAILTFLSALEQVDADLWVQYAELGGPTNVIPGDPSRARARTIRRVATGLPPADQIRASGSSRS